MNKMWSGSARELAVSSCWAVRAGGRSRFHPVYQRHSTWKVIVMAFTGFLSARMVVFVAVTGFLCGEFSMKARRLGRFWVGGCVEFHGGWKPPLRDLSELQFSAIDSG